MHLCHVGTTEFQMMNVTVNDDSVIVDPVEAIEKAVADGSIIVEESGIYLNYPVVKWAGGDLPVDDEKIEWICGKLPQTDFSSR